MEVVPNPADDRDATDAEWMYPVCLSHPRAIDTRVRPCQTKADTTPSQAKMHRTKTTSGLSPNHNNGNGTWNVAVKIMGNGQVIDHDLCRADYCTPSKAEPCNCSKVLQGSCHCPLSLGS